MLGGPIQHPPHKVFWAQSSSRARHPFAALGGLKINPLAFWRFYCLLTGPTEKSAGVTSILVLSPCTTSHFGLHFGMRAKIKNSYLARTHGRERWSLVMAESSGDALHARLYEFNF